MARVLFLLTAKSKQRAVSEAVALRGAGRGVGAVPLTLTLDSIIPLNFSRTDDRETS